MMMRRAPTQQGYTLLEVMIALALFSLLAVMATVMLDSSLRFRGQLQQQADAAQREDQVWQLLARDLQQLQWRQGRDLLGQRYPSFIWHQAQNGNGSVGLLSFTSRGRPAWLDGQWLDRPQQVSWRLDNSKQQLQRRHNLLLDPAQQNRAPYHALLDDVQQLRWQFWLDGEWRNTLPQDAVYPRAIRIELQRQHAPGPVSRIFLLPEARP